MSHSETLGRENVQPNTDLEAERRHYKVDECESHARKVVIDVNELVEKYDADCRGEVENDADRHSKLGRQHCDGSVASNQ